MDNEKNSDKFRVLNGTNNVENIVITLVIKQYL